MLIQQNVLLSFFFKKKHVDCILPLERQKFDVSKYALFVEIST